MGCADAALSHAANLNPVCCRFDNAKWQVAFYTGNQLDWKQRVSRSLYASRGVKHEEGYHLVTDQNRLAETTVTSKQRGPSGRVGFSR